MQPWTALPRRPHRQTREGHEIRGAVADFVEHKSPRPAPIGGTGDRAVEIGAGQAQHHEQRRQRPAAKCDTGGGPTGRQHPGGGEHVRGHSPCHSGVDDGRQHPGEPRFQHIQARHPPQSRRTRSWCLGNRFREGEAPRRAALPDRRRGGCGYRRGDQRGQAVIVASLPRSQWADGASA